METGKAPRNTEIIWASGYAAMKPTTTGTVWK